MDANAIIALLSAAILAFVVRVFNMVGAWLSKVLGVDPPEPIKTSDVEPKADDKTPGNSGP
jgi:hypothetical protein